MEMLLVALLAGALASNLGPIPTEGPPPAAELSQLRVELVNALNQHRASNGLPALVQDPTAQLAAQFQAEEMLQTGQLSHEDSTGRSPMVRFESYGGKAMFYGENIGYRKPGVLDPVLLWQVLAQLDRAMMAEVPPNDGHRRNILSPHYSGVGIGVAVGAKGVYMSEDFVGY